jgi:hypothetical protein
MTPREKAKELISKFNFEHLGDRYILHQTVKESKRCALIAVDEIINCDSFFKTLEDTKAFTKYWYEVQQEIEKL